MSNNSYTIYQSIIDPSTELASADSELLQPFEVSSKFNISNNFIEINFYTVLDELLLSDSNYMSYSFLEGSGISLSNEASAISLDVESDLSVYGFDRSDVKVKYNFLNNLYVNTKRSNNFFIESISDDRTEIRLLSIELTNELITSKTSEIVSKLSNSSAIYYYYLWFGSDNLVEIINIKVEDYNGNKAVIVKLYSPLSENITLKSNLDVVERVANSALFEIEYLQVLDTLKPPTLQGPNFDISIDQETNQPSQYFNYDELLSYPTSNSYRELNSLFAENSIEISIDYSDFSDFINFSSAVERLKNFKYKVDLLYTYQTQLELLHQNSLQNQGITGSVISLTNLINGITSNFDHYERHLYYTSGSTSWPKVDNKKPYTTVISTEAEAVTWYNSQLEAADNFDVSNYSALSNTIPEYIREDDRNNPYILFYQMIGQHFDNIWVYIKAVSDKYDNDNRLSSGVSKDLVEDLLKNFGVKLYTSTKSIEDLFRYFTQNSYDSGEEVINNTITLANSISQQDYQKEIYKRIYHNLPLLLKSKGTERGIRALINCFGIPSDLLTVKLKGGENQSSTLVLGGERQFTGSLARIRVDNTGSLAEGSTLSQYTSIRSTPNRYTQDLHIIEIGFSPIDNVDNYILGQLSGSLVLDNYIGDPRDMNKVKYISLNNLATTILQDTNAYDLKDYIRLIKFYDNVLFKMLVDFLPARSVDIAGIIIRPNILNRSKSKAIQVTATNNVYSGLIDTLFITGSNAGAFRKGNSEYSTNYIPREQTPTGMKILNWRGSNGAVQYDRSAGESKIDGIFRNSTIELSDGELNRDNPFKKYIYPTILYNVNFFSEPLANVCTLIVANPATLIVRTSSPAIRLSNLFRGAANATYLINGIPLIGSDINTLWPINGSQYEVFTIQAVDPNFIGCIASKTVQIVDCSLSVNLVNKPNTVIAGISYNISTWFNLGINLNVQYKVNGSTNVTPTNYIFNGTEGQVINVTVEDTENPLGCIVAAPVTFSTCGVYFVGLQSYVGTVNVPNYFSGQTPSVQYYFVGYQNTVAVTSRILITGNPSTFPMDVTTVRTTYGITATLTGVRFFAVNSVSCEAETSTIKFNIASTGPVFRQVGLIGYSASDWPSACAGGVGIGGSIVAIYGEQKNGQFYSAVSDLVQHKVRIYTNLTGTAIAPTGIYSNNDLYAYWNSSTQAWNTIVQCTI